MQISSPIVRSRCKTQRRVQPKIYSMKTISIIDSHTGGEPTRLVTAGGPDLGQGPLPVRLERVGGGIAVRAARTGLRGRSYLL